MRDPLATPLELEARVAQLERERALRPALVTALPEPVLGREVYYAAGGGLWHLVCDDPGGLAPWACIGGDPLFADDPDDGTTTSATYGDLTGSGAGPSITLPLFGNYRVEVGAEGSGTVATAVQRMAVKRGAAATSDADSILQQPPGANFVVAGPGGRPLVMNSLAAGAVLKCEYKTNAGTATFFNRQLTVMPRRVG